MTMLRPKNAIVTFAITALILAGCEVLDGLGGQAPTVNLDKKAVEHVAGAAQDSGEYEVAAGVYEKYAASHPGDVAAQASFGEAPLQARRIDKAPHTFPSTPNPDPIRTTS